MTPKRLTFADIQTSDLLYYDPDLEETCLSFCRDRNIDCLPCLDDPLKFYQRTETGFREEQVTPDRKVQSRENIFDALLLERFRRHHLLFVYADQELTGVVHFSDYNKPVVDAYLFGLLSSYERSLRKLLASNELTNEDMLAYFQWVADTTTEKDQRGAYIRKRKTFEKYRPQNEKLPLFERFYLDDLIELVRHKELIEVSQQVADLRNQVMHAHELVHMHDANQEDYIYDFNSFEEFFNQVGALLQGYKRVNNRIMFLEFTEQENLARKKAKANERVR
jgi:hypothetical protein